MPKYGGNKISALGVSPNWVKSRRRRERGKKKNSGLGVAQAAVTERWPQKEDKTPNFRKLVITMASYALQTPPRMAHASRLDQKSIITMVSI